MILKQLLENVATENEWQFDYGRQDHLNLGELEKSQIKLFVEPIGEDPKFNEYGQETMTYFGRFVLAISSDVDENYPKKYEDYIKEMKENQLPKIKTKLQCHGYQINQFRTLEAINIHDQNADGVLVNYNITLID